MGILRNKPKLVPLPERHPDDPMALQRAAISMCAQMVVFGEGDLDSCYNAVCGVAPIFRSTLVEFIDLGDETSFWSARLPESNSGWAALQGRAGSAIFVTLPTHDLARLELVIGDVMLPFERRLPKPWSYAEVKPKALFPEQFSRIFETARMVDAWEIQALAHLRPTSMSPQEDAARHEVRHAASTGNHGAAQGEAGTIQTGVIEAIRSTPTNSIDQLRTRSVADSPAAGPVDFSGSTQPDPPSAVAHPVNIQSGISMDRGQNVKLAVGRAEPMSVLVEISWAQAAPSGESLEHDTSAIVLGQDGKVLSDKHFIFFNNLATPDGSVVHSGSNTAVGANFYRSAITVHLSRAAPEVKSIVFAASIYEAEMRGHSYRQIRDAYIRVLDVRDNLEIARFAMGRPGEVEIAMLFGELYLNNGQWKFRAIGQGYASGLKGIAIDYGVDVT